ncbi:MAG: elongation factor G [Deferribacteraceae bacterium]|jgi:elongation factor G|nr:elongation factor G [Deferribacteraceae bacterium]
MDTQMIRNVAFISHGGAGKTSLVEAILFNAGITKRIGDIENGTSVMDYDPVEISRKLSINLKSATVEWNKYLLNIIDTPGYANFLHETKVALSAAGSAVVIASAITGIKAETERVWEYADEFSLARLIFVNKMDKERADFLHALADIEKAFKTTPIPLYLPIGAEDSFKGVVDLIQMKALIYPDDASANYKVQDIPSDMKAEAERYRNKLVEAASETDDALIEKYLDSGELTDDEIKKGVREGTITKKFIPVLCGSATKNIGAKLLLESIIKYLPSPADESPRPATDMKSKNQIFVKPTDNFVSAYVFKTFTDPFAGKLTLFRVLSGSIKNETELLNSMKGEKERITQLNLMQGKNSIKVDEVTAGQIAMVSKLRYTETFDTLCSVNNPVSFEKIILNDPVIAFSIVPKSKEDEDKVSTALHKLLEEDPGLHIRRDPETSELLLSGMGQMHIETVVEKLHKKFNVQVDMKAPKVPYRETIKGKASGQGKYKKQSGGRGQYGDVWLEITPLDRGAGFEFEDRIVGGVVPRNYIPAVEKGVRETMLEGVFSGYPMVDFKIALYDGSYHSVDSSEMAFKVAASMAYKKIAMDAKPILLEPIMNLDVFIPEEYVGNVIGDLNSRRGRILNVEPQTSGQHIRAQAPMSEILTYAPDLRSMTGGHGMFTMEFAYYEELPSHLTEKVVSARNEEKNTG